MASLLKRLAARGARAVLGEPGAPGAAEDAGVERLLERISTPSSEADRREAMGDLRDLVADNPAAQLALGAMGLPVLSSVLRDDRGDIALIRGALEVLLNAVGAAEFGPPAVGSVAPGALNAELLAREPATVALLLGLLEETDFYVRYHVLQDGVVACPLGVARLMDALLEREVLRNEALLLLVALTRGHEDIAKLAVFEGAFERLFNVVREEGGADGGILVQDCLELLNNLLRAAPANQLLLRENGLHARLPPLLALRPPPAGSLPEALPRQKAANLLCALETVAVLLAPQRQAETGRAGAAPAPPGAADAHRLANRASLLASGTLDALLALALGGTVASAAVRTAALQAAADLVADYGKGQEALGNAAVALGAEEGAAPRVPALQAALRSALHARAAAERTAADRLLRAYCAGNSDGQALLASTLAPLTGDEDLGQGGRGGSSDEDSDAASDDGDWTALSFGSMLVRALVGADGRGDLAASCRAASVLAHLLTGNPAVKERVLRIPLEMPSGRGGPPPDLLLPHCLRYLAQLAAASSAGGPPTAPANGRGRGPPPPPAAEAEWLQAVLLRLLVTWLDDCPPAVAALLTSPAHLPLLAQLASNSAAGTHVPGLAAVLLGICLLHEPSAAPAGRDDAELPSAPAVLEVLVARVGLADFFLRWEAMVRSGPFRAAAQPPPRPRPLTRAGATAAAAAASGEGEAAGPYELPAADVPAASADAGPYDRDFVRLVERLQPRVRARALAGYARGSGGTGGARGGLERSPGADGLGLGPEDPALPPAGAWEHEPASVQADRWQAVALQQDAALRLLRAQLTAAGEQATAAAAAGGDRGELEAALGRQRELAAEELAAARAAAEEARGEAHKLRGDLEALSGAYNTIEADSYRLEAEARELRTKLAAAQAEVAEAAAAAPHLAAAAPVADVAGAGSTEEALAAAREAGASEARAEGEADMAELLVCLGQEEAKCERLQARLVELGESAEAIEALLAVEDAPAEE